MNTSLHMAESVQLFQLLNDSSHLHLSEEKMLDKCFKILKCQTKNNVPTKVLKSFLQEVKDSYFNNQFHNFIHAYEVFDMCYILCEFVIDLDNVHKTLLLICALCHDIKHSGFSNKMYLENTEEKNKHVFNDDVDQEKQYVFNEIINNYSSSFDSLNDIHSNASFNEQMHIDHTISIIEKYFYKYLKKNKIPSRYLRDVVTSIILSTDISLHENYMSKIDMKNSNSTLSNMIMVIKIADLSHTFRSFRNHLFWVFRLIKEQNVHFYNLNDVSENTLTFINTYVTPLIDIIKSRYHYNSSSINNINIIQCNLKRNIKIWNGYLV